MDRQEFARRWQDGQQKFYRMAWCYVKNEHDALDIVGEAAYRGLKHLHTLQEPAYFETWMTRIVINAAIDHLRRGAPQVDLEDAALSNLPAPPEGGLDIPEALDLYDAIDALPEREKTCVILRYFEDYSFPQLSAILGEPEATIKSRLYRSLRKLRAHLTEGGTAS